MTSSATSRTLALAADALDRRPVALGRRDRAPGADHRLADEGRRAPAERVERPREVVGIVVGHLGDVADERAVAVADGGDAGERGAVRGGAVVGVAPRDDHRPLRLPQQRPVAADDLRGGVDRLGAARAEEDGRVGHRHERRDPLGQVERRPVRVVAEDVVRGERAELGADRVGDLSAAVAHVREPEPGGRVEVLRAVLVPDPDALAAGEHELVPVHLAHRREGMPEAGAAPSGNANAKGAVARPLRSIASRVGYGA